MKKVKISISLIVLGFLTSMTQMDNKENVYFPLVLDGEVVFKYMDSKSSVKHTSLAGTVVLDGKEYFPRLMRYSWGSTDTAFFRTENEVVYYFDKKSRSESISMPADLKIGVTWTSTDRAWQYEITSLSAKLETPVRKYKDLLVIRATQLQNRDRDKLPVYLNYYQKNIGQIGSETNGKLMTYRLEK
jgi:hypothetical protein